MKAQEILTLFGGFSDEAYLQFLSRNDSASWVGELLLDGGADLDLDPVIRAADLAGPLETFQFPCENASNFESVLEPVLIGYSSALVREQANAGFRVSCPRSSLLLCISLVLAALAQQVGAAANEAFTIESGAAGPAAGVGAIKDALEHVKAMRSTQLSVDSESLLKRIEGVPTSEETACAIFRDAFRKMGLDPGRFAMLTQCP